VNVFRGMSRGVEFSLFFSPRSIAKNRSFFFFHFSLTRLGNVFFFCQKTGWNRPLFFPCPGKVFFFSLFRPVVAYFFPEEDGFLVPFFGGVPSLAEAVETTPFFLLSTAGKTEPTVAPPSPFLNRPARLYFGPFFFFWVPFPCKTFPRHRSIPDRPFPGFFFSPPRRGTELGRASSRGRGSFDSTAWAESPDLFFFPDHLRFPPPFFFFPYPPPAGMWTMCVFGGCGVGMCLFFFFLWPTCLTYFSCSLYWLEEGVEEVGGDRRLAPPGFLLRRNMRSLFFERDRHIPFFPGLRQAGYAGPLFPPFRKE